jgi:hypothetical protein
MFSGFGALVSGMVLLKLPYQLGKLAKDETEGIQLALTIVGGVAIGMAVIFAFTMPNLSTRRSQGGVVGYFNNFFTPKTNPTDIAANNVTKEPRYEEEEPKNPFKLLKYGILAGRDPRVALAYFSSFVVTNPPLALITSARVIALTCRSTNAI